MSEELELIKKYKDDPSAFCEDFFNVKLKPYQKIMLNAMSGINKKKEYINSRIQSKRMMSNMHIRWMKAMGMDFYVWRPEGIKVYEKGMLVKVVKH
jgi:hypothetical protein